MENSEVITVLEKWRHEPYVIHEHILNLLLKNEWFRKKKMAKMSVEKLY